MPIYLRFRLKCVEVETAIKLLEEFSADLDATRLRKLAKRKKLETVTFYISCPYNADARRKLVRKLRSEKVDYETCGLKEIAPVSNIAISPHNRMQKSDGKTYKGIEVSLIAHDTEVSQSTVKRLIDAGALEDDLMDICSIYKKLSEDKKITVARFIGLAKLAEFDPNQIETYLENNIEIGIHSLLSQEASPYDPVDYDGSITD